MPEDIDTLAFPALDPGEVLEGSDDWQGSIPLTPGQAMRVEHLLNVETDTLARDVLIGLQREGMPSKASVAAFMGQFAEWTWDDLSSALAMRVLEDVRNSDWDELLGYSDSDFVETAAQDLGNNTREGLIIFDAKTKDILLELTGVLREDGSQFVGMQDTEVEALKGLPLIFIHNPPEWNGSV